MVMAEVTTIAARVIELILMVILGLLFFLINLWIIDFAAIILKLKPAEPLPEIYVAFVILSAAVLSAASMMGSRKRH